jgi:rare lipoprotein A
MRRTAVLCALLLGPSLGASATEQGLASFYGAWRAGDLTAAHRTLPMGSQVKIMNLDNGRVVVVKIVDRGPFIRGRIIDVSPAVAETLGFRDAGLAHVEIVPVTAEMAAMEARVEPQPALVASVTCPDEICSYGSRAHPEHGQAARVSEQPRWGRLQARMFNPAGGEDDWTVAAEALVADIPSRGVDAAASISVSALAEVAATEATPVVVALVSKPPVKAASVRGARGCGAAAPCGKPASFAVANPGPSFFARIRQIVYWSSGAPGPIAN